MIKESGFLVSLTSHIMSAKYKRFFFRGFPGGSDGQESACNAGNPALIPGLGRSPGEGNDNPLQYSCLKNPLTEEPCGLQSMGGKESDTTEQLTPLLFNVQFKRTQRENKEVYETSFSSNT